MQHQRNAITATVHLGPEHEHHPVDMQPMGASDRVFIDVHATDTQRPAGELELMQIMLGVIDMALRADLDYKMFETNL